jgi:hypothetical protein
MPPKHAKRRTAVRWSSPGRKSKESAAHDAVTMPTRNWPSTPMLNRPPLKQTDTASAAKISGVAIESTAPTLVTSLKAKLSIAPYTVSGLSP